MSLHVMTKTTVTYPNAPTLNSSLTLDKLFPSLKSQEMFFHSSVQNALVKQGEEQTSES